MKINTVQLVGGSETFNFKFDSSNNTADYIIKGIEGLGPPDIDLAIVGYGNDSTKTPDAVASGRPRVIVIALSLNPGPGKTYDGLRDAIYAQIDPGRWGLVNINLMEDAAVKAVTSGYITKVEPTQFTNMPELQITIQCLTGMLFAQSPIVPDTSGFIMGQPFTLNNPGTAAIGIQFKVRITEQARVWGITNTSRGGSFIIPEGISNLGGGAWQEAFQVGDVMGLNSDPYVAPRDFLTTRGGGIWSLIDYVYYGTNFWPKLYPGDNVFTFNVPGWNGYSSKGYEWVSLSYTPQYWGV